MSFPPRHLPLTIAAAALGFCLSCSDSEPESASEGSSALQCQGVQAGAAPLRLMTRAEYNNTVYDLLGDATNPADAFPKEHRVASFENNAELHIVNPLLVEKYAEAARTLADRQVEQKLDQLAPCTTEDFAACAASFIRSFGDRAFRRPLTAPEFAIFEQLYAEAAAELGYAGGIGVVLEAMLQSPQFLYRVEAPIAPTSATGAVLLGPYELASRLAYFLWDSMPDEALLKAAASGELTTAEQVEAQARRMLEDPKARRMVADFHRQWLALDRFNGIVRDAPDAEAADRLPEDLRRSLELFLDHVFWEGGGLQALLTSPTLFVNAELAQLYGQAESLPVEADQFVGLDVPERRFGLLTQPGLMAMFAHPDQSAPVQRGVFVLEQLLCEDIPSPPPTVDQTPPDPDPSLTTRERFKVHTEERVCRGCHNKIDGIGFGFENYDYLGRYRADEYGIPVDASGNVIDSPEPELNGPFNGAAELAARLSTSSRVQDCLATHWYRYAMGRVEDEADACSLDDVRRAFRHSSGNFKELLVAITLTDAFRYRPPLPEDGVEQ